MTVNQSFSSYEKVSVHSSVNHKHFTTPLFSLPLVGSRGVKMNHYTFELIIDQYLLKAPQPNLFTKA